jgi:hypothetical protein
MCGDKHVLTACGDKHMVMSMWWVTEHVMMNDEHQHQKIRTKDLA